MKQVNFAIIGCGKFGEKRIKAFSNLSNDIKLAGVYDQNDGLKKSFKHTHGINYYESLENLLDDKTVDAVVISVPNKFHLPLALQAIKSGKHVLVEKPLALNTSEVRKIIRVSKRYKRLVKTGSNHRFFPTVEKAYELYKDGLIGKILSFKGSIGNNGETQKKSWFWDKNIAGGGTFIDNACHLLDITRMFMGDFHSCLGQVTKLYWTDSGVEDYGTGIFVTHDNRQALITSSWTQWTGYLYFEIWGEKGYIFVDSRNCDKTTIGFKDPSIVKTFDFSNCPFYSYEKELTYFSDCIRKNKQPSPNAEEGLKVISMIEGVYRSTQIKRWVKL